MVKVCVFDVMETLLDLKTLDSLFEGTLGDATARQQWFSQVVQSAMVSTITDAYQDFSTIGRASLEMMIDRRRLKVADEQTDGILEAMRRLRPHPDVAPALERLKSANVRMTALSNSTVEVVEEQLANAGLRDYFERILSADSVRQFKPAPRVYQKAAEVLGVQPSEMRLISAHDWDVSGALHAGCMAAFVAREDQVLNPLSGKPDIVGKDLGDVAEQIIALQEQTSGQSSAAASASKSGSS
ncbi:MAG: haloacid dehalogenase type II [Candidatus Eremiobacter antarcticus]|nr:haloacid dehalogenase type II [Candidatus Eremiobacteraeota bacterium]MBC5807469.1 haloacid dehalogenase type II [Candidatus Eremiobacteraeota bacterium]PZR61471.1 MAG: haloacid dehalogenase type II [Candidatus Eremiobacter sp. RRmetagenome_bin22]